ncbi:MAG: LysR family transcriptional regulator [Pseudomonadota bacterium]
MRINYDFADLQAFLAVMETGSFHQAAVRLNLSQPSITRRIHKLEDALGSTLFERTTRAVRPTLAAKRLKVSAEMLVDTAQETTRALRDETQAFARQRAQVLTVASIPTALGPILLPALQALHAKAPGLRLRLLDLSANDVTDAVEKGDADLGLSSISFQSAATQFIPVMDDPLVLVTPPDHPLGARAPLDWSDLQGERVILPARGTGNRLLIDDAMARQDTPAHWGVEVGRSTSALDLVRFGYGVAVLPRLAVAGQAGAGLTWHAIGTPPILRPVGLVTRTAQPQPPLVAEAKALIQAHVKGLIRAFP